MLIRSSPLFKMFRITRAERASIRTAVARFYREAMQNLFKLLPVALALGAIISSSTRLLAQPEQPTPDELRAKIIQDLPGWLKQYNVPSASVAYIAERQACLDSCRRRAEPRCSRYGQDPLQHRLAHQAHRR